LALWDDRLVVASDPHQGVKFSLNQKITHLQIGHFDFCTEWHAPKTMWTIIRHHASSHKSNVLPHSFPVNNSILAMPAQSWVFD
jgi:hypothetical protein